MKKILLILMMAATLGVYAKNVTQQILVKGECDMCKDKIEKALDVPGVSFAEWNVESKMLTIRYNDKKISENQIYATISGLGYATDKTEANTAAQQKLNKCCQPKDAKKACGSEKAGCCEKKK